MSYEFRLPDVGEGIAEAEIVRWLVPEGAQVALDQPIVQIQTDKAIVEVPSPLTGALSRYGGHEGERLQVGQVLALLEPADTSGAVSKTQAAGSNLAVTQTKVTAGALPRNGQVSRPSSTPAHRPLATPAVRKLARELAVDLEAVVSSGPDGRITAEDVRRASEGVQMPASSTASLDHNPQGSAALIPPPQMPPEDERVPLRGLRRTIAESMATSWRTIPHLTGMDEIDVTVLMDFRQRLNKSGDAAAVHMTYLPFIVKAVAASLKQFPAVNASLDETAQEIIYHHRYNIGIATATPDGLIVPVIHDSDRKTLRELQVEITELTDRARSRRIGLEALRGGTFTVTNFGSLGGWLGTPIIRPGEAAILGIGRIQEKPWVVDGQLAVRPVLALSLSADHRLIDGDVATAFMRCVSGYLSDPVTLFLDLA